LLALVSVLLTGFFAAAHATTINVTGTAPNDWATIGNAITLNDGDILNIAAAAGSPGVSTQIQIAANANVTINGSGAMITNLRIADDTSDTQEHAVNINNLQITSGASVGYGRRQGVLHLTGANAIAGASGYAGIYDTRGGVLTITSTSNGTLTASSDTSAGIRDMTALNIEGSAHVTASSSTSQGILMGGAANAINVAVGATLTATSSSSMAIYSVSGSLAITCDGGITASGGSQGIYASGQSVSITGNSTLTATGDTGILADSLTVNQTTVNATGNGPGLNLGLSIFGATNVALTDNATLNLTGGTTSSAFGGPGFTLGAGSSVTLNNHLVLAESHPFTMGTAGGTWQLAGDAAFFAPSTAASSPATISVAAGESGTITLKAPPPSATAAAVPTLNPAALAFMALALLGLACWGFKRRV
jgi:hypothetical protein